MDTLNNLSDRKRLIIYGCGEIGKGVLPFAKKTYQVIAYLDRSVTSCDDCSYYCDIPIFHPAHLQQMDFDFVLIASTTDAFVCEIKNSLLQMEIPSYKVLDLSTIGTRLIIYGCGNRGTEVLSWIQGCRVYDKQVVAYVDKEAETRDADMSWLGVPVLPPNEIQSIDFDYILLSGSTEEETFEMKQFLLASGVPDKKILDVSILGFRDVRYYFIQGFANYIYTENMIGNVAECGVYRGINARFINLFFPDRKLYLFDTFEGFTDSDLNDEREIGNQDFLDGRFNKKCFKTSSPDSLISIVKSRMTYLENVVIKKGYFPETTEDVDSAFCFVACFKSS